MHNTKTLTQSKRNTKMEGIQEIVNQKVSTMVAEGAIQEAIESGVSNAIEKAIKSQFESYGSITKQIEKALEEGLRINTKNIPFESYNEQMLVAVKSRVGSLFQSQASERFMDEMDKILAAPPKEMTAKELVETIAAMWKTDEPWDASELDDYATVELEEGDGVLRNTYTLKMWKQKESSSSYLSQANSPDIQLYIIDGSIRISHKQSYNPTCFAEHEALIFKLYAAGTVITGIEDFDADDCDLTLKDEEY